MRITQIISAKRDGMTNSEQDLEALILGFCRGEVPDYQVSAWLMAAFLKGLDLQETVCLTRIMANSGQKLDLSSLPVPRIDKHSTGGVGDKTSLVVVPLLAACGCTVVKMSGRGLGITGGTVDKLESIPGFRTSLDPETMVNVAARCGCCLCGQSEWLAPADKLLYALRDSTATVESIPLITASILSKKLAGGANNLILDVKCGTGAFMPTLERAEQLARTLITVAAHCGLSATACITDMNAPLGWAVGNAVEVVEAIDTLHGRAEPRFQELCVELAAEGLLAAAVVQDITSGRELALRKLQDGSALERFRQMVELQGGDRRVCENPHRTLEVAPGLPVYADHVGYVSEIHAGKVGHLVLQLGAGRAKKEDTVDPAVGVVLQVSVGDRVERGQLLGMIHARDEAALITASKQLRSAIRTGPDVPSRQPVVLKRIPAPAR